MTDNKIRITQKINEIKSSAEYFPGVVIIHNVQEKFSKIEYMSERGCKILNVSLDYLLNMEEDYHARFFNEEDAKDYVPKLVEMIERNDDQAIYSFFQQVRSSPEHDWMWYHSSTRILLRDAKEEPLLTITFAVPIDPSHHLTHKVSRLLDENNFLRANYSLYAKLSAREKEVIKKMAQGQTSLEIANDLFITNETVRSHRKNIYQKLNINSGHELLKYARAFDLV